jgi:hypothetical protein
MAADGSTLIGRDLSNGLARILDATILVFEHSGQCGNQALVQRLR